MTSSKVNAIRSVAIGVVDVAASATFYREIWGLIPVSESPEAVYLRGTGPDHHLLALIQHDRPQVLRLDMTAPDRAAVDALHASLSILGSSLINEPATITEPGGGYGFSFGDHEGRTIRILTDPICHAAMADHPDRPSKITHVVLNSSDPDMVSLSKLYCDSLGFTVINKSKNQSFLKCNADHHSLAFVVNETNALNHIAFAMTDVDAVVRGAVRMSAHGYPIGWGVGQHSAGEDVYAYFEGPDGGAIEYIAKVPLDWNGAASGTPNWDTERRPNAILAAAQRRIPFHAA